MGGKLQSLVAESHQLLYVFCCNRLSQVPFKKTFENALFHMIGDHNMPNAHNNEWFMTSSLPPVLVHKKSNRYRHMHQNKGPLKSQAASVI